MDTDHEPYRGAAAVLAGLKDFQRDTVEHVFKRLFTDNDHSTRFLVADEVGLGKTLVAKGVIAKAIEHLQDEVHRVDVIYICSNAEIARQNIQKLNVTGARDFQLASWITLLPLTLRDLSSRRLNFASFTPGTSFNLRSTMGLAEERVVLYHMLQRAWGEAVMRRAGPLKVLRGGVTLARFGQQVRDFDATRLDRALSSSFKEALAEHDRAAKGRGEPGLKRRFQDLADYLRRRTSIPSTHSRERSRLIGELRAVLARTCISALEPDLIILDEFQRFRELLDGDDAAAELARQLFEYEGARTLLLSATPYKMVTLADEAGGEDHYRDFTRTLRFLMGEDAAADVDENLRRFRTELLRSEHFDIDAARAHRVAAEKKIRKVMCRTERLAVTADRNGMLEDRSLPDVTLSARDVCQFIALDRLAEATGAIDVTEFWKSAPFLLNFMDGYQFVHKIAAARRSADHASITRALADVDDLIDWRDVERYRALDPGNARLRAFMADLEVTEMWRWLWMPPSLPYYSPASPYDSPEACAASKHLVFSSWAVVPKMVAALTSYDTERRMMSSGHGPVPSNSPEDRRRAGFRLRFTRSRQRLTGMRVLALLYPSASLAHLGDPLRYATATMQVLDREVYMQSVREEVATALAPWTANAPVGGGNEDEDWYWLAPLLLDWATAGVLDPISLFDDHLWTRSWLGESDGDDPDADGGPGGESGSTFEEHLTAAYDRFQQVKTGDRPLGRVPADLVEVVALLAAGGPAVCALRALSRPRGVDALHDPDVIAEAAGVAWSFRSLFNLPEVTALIRGSHGEDAYWRAVLDYTIAGNLQAVLDEYVHIVLDRIGLDPGAPETLEQLAGTLRDTVTIRTVSYSCHDVTDDGDGPKWHQGRHRMRGRFAIRFGQDRVEDTNDTTRTSQVRDAFNSPFWPFVLATTSVGQEGLDFHSYCHTCVHWNLPPNPVDLEQREGRVHRYKGHAVRKNVAERHRPSAFTSGRDPWQALFDAAVAARGDTSDLVPFWMYDGQHHIERIVPVLPLSREVGRFAALRRSVAAYRLVMGQPRQDDLLKWLAERYTDEELTRLQEELRIDLSPPARSSRI